MSDTLTGFQEIIRHSQKHQSQKHQSQKHSGSYKTPITQNWKQGRTCYGGLTLALAYEAVQKSFTPLPPLRSLHINFVGPVTDDPVFTAQILRQGRHVTSALVSGTVEADGTTKPIASANFVFGAARASELSAVMPAPNAPPPDDCAAFIPEFARAMTPQFFHNFDTRLIAGARPMQGHDKGYIRVWSRHFDEASRDGIASLLCIADVLPPAAMPMLKKMGPISSVNFTLNILVDVPQTQDGWWHIESRQSAAQGGYSSQIMRIWNSDGVLIAEGMQCVAIFV